MKSTINETMIFNDLDIDALVEEAMRPMRAMSDVEYNAYWAEIERMKASVPPEERVSAIDFVYAMTEGLNQCKCCTNKL